MAGVPPSLWTRLRKARVPQLLGVYLGVGFGVLQGVDMFVERLGVPDWAFAATLVLLVAGLPVVVGTALVQGRVRRWEREARRSRGEAAAPDSQDPGPGAASAGAPAVPPSLAHLLTWGNTLRAGVVAFASLGLAVGVVMALRAGGVGGMGSLVAAGVLERQDRVLVADFQSQTGHDVLAGTITEAFRVDFEQSPLVSVVEPRVVREALVRMQRDPREALTPELATEVALREGIKAVLEGEVNTAGGAFVLTARLLATEGGDVLASFRETAADSSDVIGAVDRLSNRMRERVGESLRSIRQGESLAGVSTGSLSALRLYSQAVRAMDLEGDALLGIGLLEEALALDPSFAMAWRKLGVALLNQGQQRERWLEAFTQAYQLSDRLTDRERYQARAIYYTYVEEDEDRAVAAYRTLLELYPDDTTALNNLAAILGRRSDHEGALALYERARTLEPMGGIYYMNPISHLVALGRLDEAEELLEVYGRLHPGQPRYHSSRAHLLAAAGEWDEAAVHFREVRSHRDATPGARLEGEMGLANLALLRGRVAEAEERRSEVARLLRAMEFPSTGWGPLAFGARVALALEADTARALELGLRASREELPTGTAVVHLQVASFLLGAGVVEEARREVQRYRNALGDGPVPPEERQFLDQVEASLLVWDGPPREALSALQALKSSSPCPSCLAPAEAKVHLRMQEPEAAIRALREFLDTPRYAGLEADSYHRGPTLEWLGLLLEEAGDREGARDAYRRLVELWQDADPSVAWRAERAAGRLEALQER